MVRGFKKMHFQIVAMYTFCGCHGNDADFSNFPDFSQFNNFWKNLCISKILSPTTYIDLYLSLYRREF